MRIIGLSLERKKFEDECKEITNKLERKEISEPRGVEPSPHIELYCVPRESLIDVKFKSASTMV